MKKILFIAIVLLNTIFLQAQFKYGPRVSLASTTLGGGSSSFGFQAGVFINAELRDRAGLQAEVLFSVKNGVQKSTVTNASGGKNELKTKYSFTYLDIPIYLYFPLSKHINFLIGPQISSISKATEATTGTGVSAEDSKKKDVQGVETKAGFAAGLDFDLSSPIRFGLRYTSTGGEAFSGKSSFIGVTVAYYMNW